jgi:5,10-methylene-tetrahydrofolate dehydrogenase/methenyl tetrahydrofolate cyclohydrolase
MVRTFNADPNINGILVQLPVRAPLLPRGVRIALVSAS